MTQTALKNKEIEQRREAHNKEMELEEKKFKHNKKMDIVKAITGGISAFIGSKGIPGAISAVKGSSPATGPASRSLIAHFRKNDPEWYKNYIKDLDNYTNLTSFTRLGHDTFNGSYKSTRRVDGANRVTQFSVGATLPGIAVIEWIPTLGNISTSSGNLSQTPINQILMRTKEQVLKSNSRSSVGYDAADLGYNFLATASIIIAITEFERAILVANTYRGDNAYYARNYLIALGWNNPDAIMGANLTAAKQALILLKRRFNSAIVAPADLSYYKKCLYLASLWSKDTECNPNQVYTATCKYFWRLATAADELEVVQLSHVSVDAYYNAVSELIQRIAETPDYVNMYADLRSAFSDNIFQLDPTFDNEATIFESYDASTIEQIANITTLPIYYSDDAGEFVGASVLNMGVHQDTNGYIYQGASPSSQGVQVTYDLTNDSEITPTILQKGLFAMNAGEHMLNLHKDNITGNDILDVTRWHYLLTDPTISGSTVSFRIESSDVCVATNIRLYFVENKSLNNTLTATHVFVPQTELRYILESGIVRNATAFDWMPLITYYASNSVGGGSYDVSIETFGEAQHLMHYPKTSVKTLNMVCVLSEMYIDTKDFKI